MNIKRSFRILAIFILPVVICGAIGFFTGMNMGGNMSGHVTETCTNVGGNMVCEKACTNIDGTTCDEPYDWTYMGLPGYEGGGLMGLHLGALVGLGIGIYLFWKTRSKSV